MNEKGNIGWFIASIVVLLLGWIEPIRTVCIIVGLTMFIGWLFLNTMLYIAEKLKDKEYE